MKEVDELIRGERSAIKSIDAVLGRIKDEQERQELSSLRSDHVRAVDTLKRFAHSDLDDHTESAGPWGAFTTAFAGGASLFGDKAALRALKVGEQHGLNEYREAIEDDGVNAELKSVIRSELLPNQERHLALIDRYLQ